jgi:hypothetical protein
VLPVAWWLLARVVVTRGLTIGLQATIVAGIVVKLSGLTTGLGARLRVVLSSARWVRATQPQSDRLDTVDIYHDDGRLRP